MIKYFIILCLIVGCSLPKKSDSKNNINVTVSEEVELLTTIQLLADYPLLSKTETNLKLKTLNNFNALKTDAVVPYFLSMASKEINGKKKFSYFSFNVPIDLILHYSLNKRGMQYPITESSAVHKLSSSKRDSINEFLNHYQRVYDKYAFNQFYQSNNKLYKQLIDEVNDELQKHDFINTIQNFYRKSMNSYHVILSPLQHANYSVNIQFNGKNNLYAVVGAVDEHNGIPQFDIESLTNELILHEFSHSFCNPIIDKYFDKLIPLENKDEHFRQQMSEQAYNDWQIIMYEHLVRACVIRLMNMLYGESVAAHQLELEKEKGFYLIESMNKNLIKYESQNKLSLEEYFPQLIQEINRPPF